MDTLMVAFGLLALLAGGEFLVRGAVGIAARLGLSPLVIGLTVVGFGTSMPELLTSVQAALAGSDGIALGNVIGSNIANIGLILGAAALLAPIAVPRGALRRDGAALILATLLCLGLVLWGQVGRPAGAVLLAGLAAWLVIAARSETTPEATLPGRAGMGPAVAWFVVGLGLMIPGAWALVTGAVALARALAVPEAVIGVTLVAVGTSLPELVTTLVAVRRGQGALALGNVLGSNLFNTLGILGATAVIRPLEVPAQIGALDIWVMTGATVLLAVMAATGGRIARREGIVLLALYLGYLLILLPGPAS